MSINFEKANVSHVDIIFGWISEPFVQEFWDNTQGHKDDILNFVDGRKEPSNYCDGKYFYWIASCNGHPFAMLMTIQETAEDNIDDIKLNHLSKTGNTYGIDYMIGDKNYFGKGYGTKMLSAFIDFFRRDFDLSADTFIIDPASDNPRAKHVYMKAGFEHIADFVMNGDCSGAGKSHHLLIRRFVPNVRLLPATISDYPTIQNMARFYVYDRTAYMGWECPESGLFECIDFKHYFENSDEKAFLIKVSDEIAGFVLLDKMHLLEPVDWNMGEFFVLAKFQGKGIASIVAREIFKEHPGKWSIAVMPENIKAVKFWRKIISEASHGDYREVFKTEDELRNAENPDPYAMNVFTFDVNNRVNNAKDDISIRLSQAGDISELSHSVISSMNHITLAIKDIDKSFLFYRDVLGLKPLVKWDKGAYFLVGDFWFCLNIDENRLPNPCYTHYAFSVLRDQFDKVCNVIIASEAEIFKNNTSPGESLYFLDPDGHKLEIHVGNSQIRIAAKKANPGNWKNVEWFV